MREPKYYLRQVLKKMIPKYFTGGVLIDIGAGRMKYKPLLKGIPASYIAVDNGSSPYQFSRKADKSPNLHVLADAHALPFQNESADAIICTQVIEHVARPWQIFSEISRILKPGSIAMVSSAWLFAYHPEPRDYFRYSRHAYASFAQEYKLTLCETIPLGGLCSAILAVITRAVTVKFPRIEKLLQHQPFSFMYRLLELITEQMDGLWKSEDCIGHLVILKKGSGGSQLPKYPC